MSCFTLPTVDQGKQSHLFRLPIELRQRIYQYVLTPAHVHIERKVDYKLTLSGIRIAGSVRTSNRSTTEDRVDSQRLFHRTQPSPRWNCEKIFVDPSTSFEINDRETRQDARKALFNIYYCRSQKPGGPSAVPPGYLDHEDCSGDKEQVAFLGSNMLGYLMTCQWAYNDCRAHGITTDSAVAFTPYLSRDVEKLELGSHTLHFSDLQDIVCWTGLVTPQLSESLSKLSVHVDTMDSPYWSRFCKSYLQPWAPSCFEPWEWEPKDKYADSITFYHNHTTHDLAIMNGDQEDRDEIAEALASTWVVPNIQFNSTSGSGSTKFRMSALRGRSGGPLNLRLSFPIFLRRKEPRFNQCLEDPDGEPQGCLDLPIPHSELEHESANFFNHRRWLAERHGEMPITEKLGQYSNSYDPSLEDYTDSMCEMESTLLCQGNLLALVMYKRWFAEHTDETAFLLREQTQREYDRMFADTFLQSRKTRPRNDEILNQIHPQLHFMDNCQGLEQFEMDFYGDAHSPGKVQNIQNDATEIMREGLQERFTGRGWTSSDESLTLESLFWNIGPHPEVNFTGWADPSGNMTDLNMDQNWRN
ncbi:hypothetical protein PFICI_04833 [Pestalotiopsis fici W106-1]|uniref:Uncharacterized protein n=1 Tax=Pestalotiopsis fici (strain W106-1 / CGMCC3.15140) TaxID=1229662 RepID=W3XBZ4_PESFW|nr:uncharacterized protein PFICI_04833 [Pestalotiopsis fici W106-1]ETS82957.1 hypothetical protein PFICI_04833 [Pestalotiopsis fici W106-1]